MTILLFLLSSVYLIIGVIIFIMTSLTNVPGVGSDLNNKYLNTLQNITVGNNFLTGVVSVIAVTLWPIHLGMKLYFSNSTM